MSNNPIIGSLTFLQGLSKTTPARNFLSTKIYEASNKFNIQYTLSYIHGYTSEVIPIPFSKLFMIIALSIRTDNSTQKIFKLKKKNPKPKPFIPKV